MAADKTVGVELDLTELNADIKRFGVELDRQVGRELGQLGDRIVNAMRAELRRSPPSSGRLSKAQRASRDRTGSHNSRQQASRGIDAATSSSRGATTLRVTSDGSKMERGREAFPASYNLKRWSHPVFGNRAARVTQRGNPYFGNVIQDFESRAESALRSATEAALDTIKGDTSTGVGPKSHARRTTRRRG